MRAAIQAIVRLFLTSKLPVLLMLASLLLGIAAVLITPREEEPQIVVPMADVMVRVPGASAEEVEKLVTTPLERILWQIDGVEHVYSVSSRDRSMATVRFFVGEDREDSLIKLHNAITKNRDLVPGVVDSWVVKPVEIDDVPILLLTLSSDEYGIYELRRMAEELFHRLARTEDVSRVTLTGGSPREVRVELDARALAGYGLTPTDVTRALSGADDSDTAGAFNAANRRLTLTSQSFLHSAEEVRALVVGVVEGKPVYLQDVARVIDGPAEADSHTRIGASDYYLHMRGAEANPGSRPAVTLALAKKPGTNAVWVAEDVLERLDTLKRTVLPDGVDVTVMRDYGETAQAKVNELLSSLGFAVLTVVLLLTVVLGWREAAVVALAVPVSFSLALFVNYLLGYTVNRVTLFALILSLGLVVDDPITNVDNIQRHILMGRKKPLDATLEAVGEVLPPVLMSTLAIIVSFTPLFFITGMMGPYMAPMAANVPLTVTFSTLCALAIVPWVSMHLLKGLSGKGASESTGGTKADAASRAEGVSPRLLGFYSRVVGPLLDSPRRRNLLWAGIALLFLGSCSLVLLRLVPLKMLPFDNKDELQIVVDLPEGSTLEDTDRVLRDLEAFLATVPEVEHYATFAGTPSPMDYNGMVRHYYQRTEPHQADVRITLADKDRRAAQSHAIALRIRPDVEAIAAAHGATVGIVESPPGPPVLATITTEVYGRPDQDYAALIRGARHVERVMAEEPFVVDIDASFEADREVADFTLDKEKAALHGVDTATVVETLALALSGAVPATVHSDTERQPLAVRVILPRAERSSLDTLRQIKVRTNAGRLVELAELGSLRTVRADQPIHHKDLERVVYVYADMAGRSPAEAILDMQAELGEDPMPAGTRAEWAGEGEWQITLDVFRDLGLAFAAALVGIYILLVLETGAWGLPLLIMSSVPLTLLGILPGFWLLNLVAGGQVGPYEDPIFFTATSMIGMIALGGIVIRNSLVLIDFIHQSTAAGMELREAILKSGAVRMRPILLTAATTALGAWPITLDPVFSGLAWALIFGLAASTLFTLAVVPAGYYALYARKDAVAG